MEHEVNLDPPLPSCKEIVPTLEFLWVLLVRSVVQQQVHFTQLGHLIPRIPRRQETAV